jgi:hypothetical protein
METLIISTENSHAEKHDATQGGFVFVTPKKDVAEDMVAEIYGGKMHKRTVTLHGLSIVLYFVTQAL